MAAKATQDGVQSKGSGPNSEAHEAAGGADVGVASFGRGGDGKQGKRKHGEGQGTGGARKKNRAATKHALDASGLIPKRGRQGPKDYAPDGSEAQQEKILSAIAEWKELRSVERVTQLKALCVGEWLPKLQKVKVVTTRGSHFVHCGYYDKDRSCMMLFPEEALFLIDKVVFETNITAHVCQGVMEVHHNGVALAVQDAMTTLLPTDMSLSHYLTYAHLRRLGYIVYRYRSSVREGVSAYHGNPASVESGDEEADKPSTPMASPEDSQDDHSWLARAKELFTKLVSPLRSLFEKPAPTAPLLHAADHRKFSETFDAIRTVPQLAMSDLPASAEHETALHVAFDVYRPSPSFKKSDPGVPDFSVCVCEYTGDVPELADISQLTLQARPANLKFAVVDAGTVCFYGLLDLMLPVFSVLDA